MEGAWAPREKARGMTKRGQGESETRQKEKQESGREKEEDEVARRRQRNRREGRGERRARGGGGNSYTPYDGVGMRESALGRLRLEWRVWYVTMRAR